MSPEQAVAEARDGKLRPIYLVVGEERYLSSIVVSEIRKAVIGGVDLGLNEDQFDADSADIETVLSAARTLPMMAARRLVVVRGLERWEPKGDAPKGEARDGGKGGKAAAFDRLGDYVPKASPTTTLVLVAGKLDLRRRFALMAKKDGFTVECETPPRNMLPSWLGRRARERQKTLGPGAAELLADIAGPDLARLDDAVERLSLYIGADTEITEDAVADVIVGVKPSNVWELVGAVSRREAGAALAAFARIYDPKDRGLPLLGTLAWSTRQLIRFHAATARGMSPPDAAKHAGAPPFKAQELADQCRRLSAAELERWLGALADVDVALKGGSRRPAQAVLESLLLTLCGTRPAQARGAQQRAQ
jgi:DNA polymerase-3 subunit delta